MLFIESQNVMLLQMCCSGDTFNMKLTFQHPKNNSFMLSITERKGQKSSKI